MAASTSEVVEFVLDLHRYRLADRKIGRVGRIERHGNTGTVRFAARIKGVPGPCGVYPFTITPTGLQFGSPIAGAARWFLDFEGTFECEESIAGQLPVLNRARKEHRVDLPDCRVPPVDS